MKAEDWVVSWNQKEGHFHIESADLWESGNPDYQEAGMVSGTFSDAQEWATQWLERNPEAKRAYRSPFA